MIKTHGLTHLSLAVRDPEHSLRFYQAVFGVREYYRDGNQIQVLGPGSHDVIAFERNPEVAGKTGGVMHFGFRLVRPGDIDKAAEIVEQAGGRILSEGYFTPDEPYIFIADPDGYEVEVWYEPDETEG